MRNLFRKIFKWLGYSLAILIIIAATIVSIGTLVTPYVDGHRADFEKWASDILKTPVTLRNVEISWYFYKPVLDFHEVKILDKDTHKKVIELEELKVHLDFFRSIFQHRIVTDYVKIAGVQLTIQQKEQAKFYISGFGDIEYNDPLSNETEKPNELVLLLLSQPYLMLDEIEIKYQSKDGNAYIIYLNELVLENSSQKHSITANAMLKQKIPLNITVGLNWYGTEIDPKKISANIYLYLEGVSLNQWVKKKSWHDIQIKQGIGSVKIWADWRDHDWQKIQTQLEFFDLNLYSEKTAKEQQINRVSGNIGWERKNNKIILAGEDILIDLPDHLWPSNSFVLEASKIEAGQLKVESFRTNYLDLDDIKKFTLDLGLLQDSYSQNLSAFDPKGELKNIYIKINDENNLANNSYSADFSYVSWRAFEKYPGMKNLSGELNWNGQQGNFKIQSDELQFIMPTIFEENMEIDQLNGELHFEKDLADHWLVYGKNIETNNHNLKAKIDLTLQSYATSPATIDLDAEFSLENGSKVINYLPLKIFSPDFSEWLKNAFHGGKITSGKAVVSGALKDFPFEKGGGKLSIDGEIHDLNLNYAKEWPMLHHLNGHLLFTPQMMLADVVSGEVLNMPLKRVHVSIPNLSEHHSKLAITGEVNSDLAKGKAFIEQSPLQKTLGKSLKDITIKGPMHLDLSLLIPLDHDDHNTKVNGNLDIINGQMNLSKWNLELSQLVGKAHFTHQDIDAKQIHASLLNENVHIDVVTLHSVKGTSVIKPVIKGRINVAKLSEWLKIPVANYIRGETDYTAELRLVSEESSDPNQLIVNSDLRGVEVMLPLSYGKAADIRRNFNLTMSFAQNTPLQIKAKYGELFSSAWTLKSEQDHLQFFSGDLHFGKSGDALFQNQPGMVITGSLDQLDYDQLSKQYPEIGMNQTTSDSSRLNLRLVDVNINQLTAFSQVINKAHVQIAKPNNKNWVLKLKGSELDGQIMLPNNNNQPLQARFKYLYLSESKNKNQSTLDPRTIPSISFIGDDVRYQDIQFGKMILDAEHARNGLQIKRWNLNSPIFEVNSSGIWQALNSGSKTDLHGTLTASDVSAFLKQWHVQSSNLTGSGGTADFDLSWKDAPYSISLANVTGSITVHLSAGRIINLGESTDAKLGIGRLLNLLSLQTIPHLISLDFGGMFAQGYSFDSIKGDINLRNGSAYIKKFVSDGSVARVAISGRMGLVAKDYDLILEVTPYVTGSIPVVAALAVNPIAGVAAFAVEKVARGAVSKVSTHRYAIGGSWNEPIWKPL